MPVRLPLRFALVALVALGGGCRSAEAPLSLNSSAFRPAKARSATLLSPPEMLGVLQPSHYPMMDDMSIDSEHTPPPPLVLVKPFFYEDISRQDGVMATVSDLDGGTLEIHGTMTWFRLRSDLGRAVMVINRHGDDRNGASIGLFVKDWTNDEMAKLQSLTEGIPWAELLEPEGGDITGAQITIKYRSKSTFVDREFNSYNWDFIGSIWPLLGWNDARQAALANERPLAGLRISVEVRPVPQKPGEYTLHVTFINPGTHPVILHDPRLPPRPDGMDPLARLVLRVAPETDYPIPRWVTLVLPPPEEGDPAMITLSGGSRYELSAPWKPDAPGTYWLSAEWIDYEPPLEGVEHAPIMPMPADLDKPFVELKAPYPMMGGAFAAGTVVVPAPAKLRR